MKNINSLKVAIEAIEEGLNFIKANLEETQESNKVFLSIENVRAVLADISRAGKKDEVRKLLQKYGSTRLSEIKPEYYEALLNDAKGLE